MGLVDDIIDFLIRLYKVCSVFRSTVHQMRNHDWKRKKLSFSEKVEA